MKKLSLARLLSLLLVAIMAASVMVACGGGGNAGGVSKEDFSALDDKVSHTEDKRDDLQQIDYKGYQFNFICQPYKENNAYTTDYMVQEEETTDVLLSAVKKRNDHLSAKYNVKFGSIESNDLTTAVRSQVMANVTEFDIIIGSARRLATLAKEGHLLDLKSVELFDMSKTYWDSNAAEQLLIGEKLFFTNCDLNVQELAFVVYFNKKLIEDRTLTSPYEYMANNEWTIDNWANLVMAYADDLNGDGEYTEEDRYGTLYENHNGRMFLFGTGVRATTNDETGYPKVTLMDTDKTVKVYDKVKKVFASASTWSIDEMPSSETHGFPDKYDYARSLFCKDHYLFHYEGTNIIHQFADMESDFGIVPFPKYDSAQEGYYSMYPFNCAMVALPVTLKKDAAALDRTARIVEDMNYYSSIWVEPAWYETLLHRRHSRDDESEANLDIIKAGRVYDVGMYYNFGDICGAILDKDVTTSNISTAYARLKKSIEADIKLAYRELELKNK